jgi:hypothetical protein
MYNLALSMAVDAAKIMAWMAQTTVLPWMCAALGLRNVLLRPDFETLRFEDVQAGMHGEGHEHHHHHNDGDNSDDDDSDDDDPDEQQWHDNDVHEPDDAPTSPQSTVEGDNPPVSPDETTMELRLRVAFAVCVKREIIVHAFRVTWLWACVLRMDHRRCDSSGVKSFDPALDHSDCHKCQPLKPWQIG